MTEPDANGWYPIAERPGYCARVWLWDASKHEEIQGVHWNSYSAPETGFFKNGCPVWMRYITHWRYPPKPPVEFEEKSDG